MSLQSIFNRIGNLLIHFNRVLARKGTYKFAIKNWERIEDVNLAQKVMDTEFFRDTIEPIPLDLEKHHRYLILAPHQDDETIGAGGLMIALKNLKRKVDVLFITDGAQIIDGYTADEVVELRNKEAKKALSYTNATIHYLGINNMSVKLSEENVANFREHIENLQPDVILLPWFMDGPVKHRVTNHILLFSDGLRKLNKDIQIWGYQVHNVLYPNTYLDISPYIETKRQMIECYNSQNEYFECYDHLVVGMNAWNSRFLRKIPGQITKQYVETFFALPIVDYLDILEKFYTKEIDELYKGRPALIKEMKNMNELFKLKK